MIYCVIPRELEDELYEKMVEYYKDNPNVTVIVDRREGDDRRARQGVRRAAGDPRPPARTDPGDVPEDRRASCRTSPRRIGAPWRSGTQRPSRTSSAANGSTPPPARRSSRPQPGDRRADRRLPEVRRRGRRPRRRRAREAAYEEWRLVPAPARGEILFRFGAARPPSTRTSSPTLMSREMGKVLAEAGGDVQEAIDMASTWPARAGASSARRRRPSSATSST